LKYRILLHPDVEKYFDSLTEKERSLCVEHLKKLSVDPLKGRSGCDIKKLQDRGSFYRLRVGDHRFLYVIVEDEILVEEAFRRGKGY